MLTGTGIMYRVQIFNIVLGFKQREHEVGTTLHSSIVYWLLFDKCNYT